MQQGSKKLGFFKSPTQWVLLGFIGVFFGQAGKKYVK